MAKYTRILGTGSYFPERILTNADLEKMVDTTDEWIVTRSGIKTRHISDGETTSQMGAKACARALEMAGLTIADIDGIVAATFSSERLLPNLATSIQGHLGGAGQFAMDVSAACTGFIYATTVADSMIKTGLAKKMLVVGAEWLSPLVDWTDRTTCVLFGDGAGAIVLGESDEPGIRAVNISADGTYGEMLKADHYGAGFMHRRKELDIEKGLLMMRGNEVFKVAVRAMADAAAKAVEDSGLPYDSIDYLIPHQANLRIIDATAKRCNLPMEKVVINLDRRGNTSAATIPTALDEAVRDGRITKGTNVVSAAFGGGLTWGAMVFTF